MLSIGHEQITSAALNGLGNRCPAFQSFCIELKDAVSKGKIRGFYNSSFLNNLLVDYTEWNISSKEIYSLGIEVLGIDFGPTYWTHDNDAGQKYHFMTHSKQTQEKAHAAATDFIRLNVELWLKYSNQIVRESRQLDAMLKNNQLKADSPAYGANLKSIDRRKATATKSLARALHCLQDSFSPSHVLRSEKTLDDLGSTCKRSRCGPDQ